MWDSTTNLVRLFFLPHLYYQVSDLDPAAANLHDGGGDASDLGLPDSDGGARPVQESRQDASSTNVSRVTDDASRECHISPNPQLF